MKDLYTYEVLVTGTDYFESKRCYIARAIEEIPNLVKEDYLNVIEELSLQAEKNLTLISFDEIDIVYIRRGKLLNNI